LSAGISILINAKDALDNADEFLASLVKYNTYKPIEVLLWAADVKKAIDLSRKYFFSAFVRVMPVRTVSATHIEQKARYENILVINLPAKISADVLPEWVKAKKTNIHNAVFYEKKHFKSTQADYSQINSLLFGSDVASSDCNKKNIDTDSAAALKTMVLEQKQNALRVNENRQPDLSIIIPCFNKAEFLPETLQSLSRLESERVEIIAIDDCSSDDTPSILKDLSKRYKNLTCYFNKENRGAGFSRNFGINNCSGKYIFFLDADDRITIHLSEMLDRALHSNADILRGRIIGKKKDGSPAKLAKEHLLHHENKEQASWETEKSLWFYWYFSSNLYKSDFIKKNFLRFPEKIRNEDPIFLCKVYLSADNISLYNKAVYEYIIGDEQRNKTPSASFLHGWAIGNYTIYQLIKAKPEQALYFLLGIPGVRRRLTDIVSFLEKELALKLLSYMSLMLSDYIDLKKQHEKIIAFSKTQISGDWAVQSFCDTLDLYDTLSGKNTEEIFSYIKASQ